MQKELEAGSKIQYRLFDKNGKEHWFKGVVHGVRRYEDPATKMITKMTYMVDTGRHERLDKNPFDPRGREITKQVNVLTDKGMDLTKALDRVVKKDDLPESGVEYDIIRQPEQIELPPEHIRPIE